MHTIVLGYSVSLGLQSATPARVAAVGAAPIFDGELDMLGMQVTSDVSSAFGTAAVRRIITLQTTPDGDARFPTPQSCAYATQNLYKDSLSAKVKALVLADAPFVT
jgi:hypothetical protein